jgi:ankyrin repeat protein
MSSSAVMPVKEDSTVSEKSAEEVLDDLDDFLEKVEDTGDPDIQSINSSASTKTVSYSYQLKTACWKCKNAASPLLCSVKLNHRSCLKDILTCLAHLDVSEEKDSEGDSAAHIAARENRLEILQLLYNYDRTILESKDHRGASPLHSSAQKGQGDCVRWMLKNGGSVFQRDFDGASAVHYAASNGHLEILKELVPLESNVAREQTYNGETPVYFAAQEGRLNCLQWLIESGDGDPNQTANDGMNPFHAAVQSGQLEAAKWLLESGHCKITSKTLDGGTAVHFAAAKGHVAILEWMFKNSLTDGTERDEFGTTPVHDAAEEGQLDCLRVFYENGVDLNMKDLDGFTPRVLAQQNKHSACVLYIENPIEFFSTLKRSSKTNAVSIHN